MYWMRHPQHGEGPVDTVDEVKLREANGWEQVPYPGPNPPADAIAPDDSIFGVGGGGGEAGGEDEQQEEDTPAAPPAAIPARRGPGRPPKAR